MPLFHQNASIAGLEPEPYSETVISVLTTKLLVLLVLHSGIVLSEQKNPTYDGSCRWDYGNLSFNMDVKSILNHRFADQLVLIRIKYREVQKINRMRLLKL